MLEKIKLIQGITNDDFDETIEMWIDAAKLDLKSVGIVDALVESPDSLIEAAIVNYVVGNMDVQNSEMYSNSYMYQKDALRHTKEYIEA